MRGFLVGRFEVTFGPTPCPLHLLVFHVPVYASGPPTSLDRFCYSSRSPIQSSAAPAFGNGNSAPFDLSSIGASAQQQRRQQQALPVDVNAFLANATALGISPQQAMALGAKMLQGQLGGVVKSGTNRSPSPAGPTVEEVPDVDLHISSSAPLAQQLASVRRSQSSNFRSDSQQSDAISQAGLSQQSQSSPDAAPSSAAAVSRAQTQPNQPCAQMEQQSQMVQQQPAPLTAPDAVGGPALHSPSEAAASALLGFGVARGQPLAASATSGGSTLAEIQRSEAEFDELVVQARQRKALAKAKAKLDAEADARADGEADGQMAPERELPTSSTDRGRGKGSGPSGAGRGACMKRPAALHAGRAPKAARPTTPDMPERGSPVKFLGAKISLADKFFRVWLDPAQVAKEKRVVFSQFGGDRGAAFVEAIKMVSANNK